MYRVLIPLTGRDRLNYTKSGRGFLRRYRTVFWFRYSFYTNPDSAENLNTNPDSIFFTQREKKNLQLLNCFFGYMEKNNGIRYRYLRLMTNLWKFLTFWNALQVPVPGSGFVFGLRIRIQKAIEYGFITGIRIWNTEWVKIFSLLNKNLLKIVFTFWTKRSCWSHQNYRTRSRSIVGGFTT